MGNGSIEVIHWGGTSSDGLSEQTVAALQVSKGSEQDEKDLNIEHLSNCPFKRQRRCVDKTSG